MTLTEKIVLLNRLFKIFLISITLISLVVSCGDDPTSIGVNLLPNKDIIDVFIINSNEGDLKQKSKYYTDSLSLSSSEVILLGKHDNVESTMLMKFLVFLPDSIKDAVNNEILEILSSTIELEPIYTYSDVSNYFDFSLHKINSGWDSRTFDKDSLSSLSYDDMDKSSNRVFTDTLITCDFDNDLAMEWLKYSAAEEQAANNQGVYFNYSTGSNKIVGFPAISYFDDDRLARLKLVVQVPGSFVDTLVVQVTSDAHIVLGELPVGASDNIFLQGGISVRSNLMIDVSKIPDNIIINSATLTLTYDESESLIGTKTSDSIGVIGLTDYERNIYNESITPTLLQRDGSVYSGDITRFVQNWVSNQDTSGLQLFLANEVTTVNKVALKGSSASDPKLKPYLEITYTSKR